MYIIHLLNLSNYDIQDDLKSSFGIKKKFYRKASLWSPAHTLANVTVCFQIRKARKLSICFFTIHIA